MAKRARPVLKALGGLAVAAMLLLVILPVVTGRPIVSYPVSGSMEPTLGPFDVFLVDPWPGRLHPGDVVVFDSVSRGQPAVHRIVGGDEAGWYTQGDANPNVDQMAGEPPVTRDRILGRVVTWPSGEPVKIPQLGVTITEAKIQATRLDSALGGRGASTLLVVAGGALLVLALLPGRAPRERAAPLPRRLARRLRRLFPRGILGRHVALGLLAVLLAAGLWSAHAARADLVTSMVVVRDAGAADGVRAASPGGEVPRELEIGSLGFLPTVVILEPGSAGIIVDDPVGTVGPWSKARMAAREVAGPEPGYQEDAIRVWRYPAFLPAPAIAALHREAPGSPDLLLAGLCGAAGWLWFHALGVSRRPVGRWIGVKEGWL